MSRDLSDEIRQGEAEQLRRVSFFIQKPAKKKNDIEKGIATDFARNQKDTPLIKKKGRDIKEKLSAQLVSLKSKKGSKFTELHICVKKIGFSPKAKMSGYMVDGFENRLKNMPLKYDHSQIYGNKLQGSAPLGQVENNVSQEVSNEIYKYNRIAYNYVKDMVECIKTQTVIDAIQEGKIYPMTVDVAAKLGF
jgi:hypothetical protein